MARQSSIPLLLVLFLVLPGFAMFEDNLASVRADGMGGAFTAIADDVSAASYNPAGLYQVTGMQFHGCYKLLFGGIGTNLHSAHAGFALPVGRVGVLGFGLQETGLDLHSERTVRLSHGIMLARDLAFGYGLNGYNVYQRGGTGLEDYSGFAFGLDLGMFARIYRIWTVGFRVHNINTPRIGTGSEGELPRAVAVGIGFSPSPGIHSAVDLEKEPGQPTCVSVGQEFRIIRDHLVLRAGVLTAPVRFAFGIRTGLKTVHLDYALRTHAELPLAHNFGVVIEF